MTAVPSKASFPDAVAPTTRDTDESAEPPQRLSFDIVVEDDAWREAGDVETWIMAAVAALAKDRPDLIGSAALALDTDAAVQRLNKAYRGLDKPTNVLSFPSGATNADHLGDIIFARETIVREAAELAIPLAHHVQHLTLHGLLHLIGYDHETDADAVVMEAIETRLLAVLNVADPYANGDPA
jgi:probable rRNA maturation factor